MSSHTTETDGIQTCTPFTTIVFMDVVGFSKMVPSKQLEIVDGLTNRVRQSLAELFERERLIVLPTGDGMAVAFFDADSRAKPTREWILSFIHDVQLWAWSVSSKDEDVSLRIGVHAGAVSIVPRDVNGRKNLCGHAINTAQRVMDASNRRGVLWSDDAVKHHFVDSEIATMDRPFPCTFGDTMQISAKHGVAIVVRQLRLAAAQAYWDQSDLESRFNYSYRVSTFRWQPDEVDRYLAKCASARELAFIHVSGGVFREHRWRKGGVGDFSPTVLVSPENEVNAIKDEPLSPSLQTVQVFIANEELSKRYRDEHTTEWQQGHDAKELSTN